MIQLNELPVILTILATIVSVAATILNLIASRKNNIKEFQDKRKIRKNEKN